jgi:hypothetical protein
MSEEMTGKKTQRTPSRRIAKQAKQSSSPSSNLSGSSSSSSSHGGVSGSGATVSHAVLHEPISGSGSAQSLSGGVNNTEENMQLRLAELERREREIAQYEARLGIARGSEVTVQLPQRRIDQPVASEQRLSPVREEVRIAAIQPQELTYVSASKGSALEDWLFKLEQLFTQTRKPEAEWQERVRIAKLYWDRHMSLWWAGCVEAAAETEAPITSWTAFVSALRGQFVPAGDAEAARLELLRLRMGGSESMDAYLQRAVLLVSRAGAFVDSKMVGVLLIVGVDSSRFPFTVQSVRRRLREAGVGGMSFAQVRAELSMEAHNEPNFQPLARGVNSSAAAASGGQRSRNFNSSEGSNSKQIRINALRKQLQALETAGEEADEVASGESGFNGQMHVAPVGTASARGSGPHRGSASSVCHKCGGDGHFAVDCKSNKELRKCFSCGKVGHVRFRCPDRNRQEGAAGAEVQSKNE